MELQLPQAMLSAFRVPGRPMRLIARPYPLADWSEGPEDGLGRDVLFVFDRSAEGRASLVVRRGSVVARRVIAEDSAVARFEAAGGWSWDTLDRSDRATRSIGGFQAWLAHAWRETDGAHELWVSLDLRIPVAEIFPSYAVIVDHVLEGPAADG